MTEHRLSILLNNNRDGTHSFHLYGSKGNLKFKPDKDVRFGEGELHDLLKKARETLRIASWGSTDGWQANFSFRYKDRRPDLVRLKEDLINMAQWGYEFYDEIGARLAGGQDAVEQFEEMMLDPGFVQIAMKKSPAYILPAATIYDYPLDVGSSGYSLCPSFEDAFNKNALLEEHECFKGQCPTRNELTVVCPSGFWGYRHYLAMPLSNTKEDVATRITFDREIKMAVGVATDLQLRQAHLHMLHHMQPNLICNEADTRSEVFNFLKASPHLVYFYCHGGYIRDVLYLQVGLKDRIMRSNLRAYKIRWNDPRPLVFLNGCHTAADDPMKALNFIASLVEYSKSAGVIGTEITIYEELASAFAEEFFRRFFEGEAIGKAIRGARLALLGEGNPLGLVYIPFAIAGLSLMKQSGA